MGPNELVLSNRKESVTSFRNLGVGPFANLVGRLQSSITAPAKRNSGSCRVQQPFVRNAYRHGRLKERLPAIPYACQRFIELLGRAVPVQVKVYPAIGSGLAPMVAGALRVIFLKEDRANSSERFRINSRRQQHHGLVAALIGGVPDPDVGNR